MANIQYDESDPRYHVNNVKGWIDDLVTHLREDTEKFDEPKAQALFETSAEVLIGMRKAFDDYEIGSEKAMRAEP